ncbi:hypothetical protein [Nocardia abscessus]|uniref:hypothetical protein n=1 Tax=Nocardia abscessus TaxID=120957 RepID=UPI0024551656|nr:hypothetical protein [Nocardia abscessus]
MHASALRRVLAAPMVVAVLAAGAFAAAGCSGSGSDNPASGDATASTSSRSSRSPSTDDGDEQVTVAAAEAGPRWASSASATITPGTQTYTDGAGQCTSNYVFVDDAGNVYLGQAAHCATTEETGETHGCTAGSLPVGTTVAINRDGSLISHGRTIGSGRLVYSSWLTMQQNGEKDRNACAYNDFALVKIAAADLGKVNPSLPHWGGPTGINTTGAAEGGRVYSYGNSSLRGGISGLSPQVGESENDDPAVGGWTHTLTAPTPGIPGDSGSAFLDRDGRALGTLSTLGIALPIVNHVGDIHQELDYARTHSGISGLRLVLGTEPFDPNR